ncbi:hypothetical protein HCN44_005595 [Aphidius gifuensis]|uniref:Nuclear nucleic acid-binding protein C1D n=1 Tax=Aphidius gifuensis TaxID=684658 RepID=A0A834Y177_APHGI|nr:nuclear nucleic acid-binding protein C1D-like [Aphidius gifuensis]KAF7997318.1 hypothetical protein HCN44_005595 [Aphidius gifuensis]
MDLKDKKNIDANVMEPLKSARDKIDELIKLSADPAFYEELSNTDKIKFNLLMSFSLNGLYWMYLRADGKDPNTNQIKSENERLKKAIGRSQEIKDRKTKMPRIDQDVAKRFIRSGLWEPKNNHENVEEENWDLQNSTMTIE